MCLLQIWYGLSDYEVEDVVNDRISFSCFCGLTIDQVAPDHSTVSRFRTALTKANAYDPLFKLINSQLKMHQIIVVKGAIVDTADLPQEIALKTDKGYQSAKNHPDLKILTLNYDGGDIEEFELSVINDSNINLYHISSKTDYEFKGRGFKRFLKSKNNGSAVRNSNRKRTKIERKLKFKNI